MLKVGVSIPFIGLNQQFSSMKGETTSDYIVLDKDFSPVSVEIFIVIVLIFVFLL